MGFRLTYIFVFIFLLTSNFSHSQNQCEKFLIDWLENIDFKQITSMRIETFSIDYTVDSTLVERALKRDVGHKSFEYETYNEFRLDTLEVVKLELIHINKKKIKPIIKQLNAPVSKKGPKLIVYAPIYRNNAYFVTYKIESEYGSTGGYFTMIWVIKYDNNWNYMSINYGVAMT